MPTDSMKDPQWLYTMGQEYDLAQLSVLMPKIVLASGMTIAEIADRMAISEKRLKKILKGMFYRATLEEIMSFCHVFNIGFTFDLFPGKEERIAAVDSYIMTSLKSDNPENIWQLADSPNIPLMQRLVKSDHEWDGYYESLRHLDIPIAVDEEDMVLACAQSLEDNFLSDKAEVIYFWVSNKTGRVLPPATMLELTVLPPKDS